MQFALLGGNRTGPSLGRHPQLAGRADGHRAGALRHACSGDRNAAAGLMAYRNLTGQRRGPWLLRNQYGGHVIHRAGEDEQRGR
jgi:hypothetical protein